MDEVMTTLPILWRWVLAICGMIVAVGGAWTILSKLSAPMKRIEANQKALEKRLDDLEHRHADDQDTNENRFEKDLKGIQRLAESDRHICRCMLALMDHEITGNSIDRLKRTRDDLNAFLIDK